VVKLRHSSRYLSSRKKFLKNNPELVEKTIKAIRLFVRNPQHPGINLEKLKDSTVWTIRIDKGNRIFFLWNGKSSVLFIDIGKHDKYRRY